MRSLPFPSPFANIESDVHNLTMDLEGHKSTERGPLEISTISTNEVSAISFLLIRKSSISVNFGLMIGRSGPRVLAGSSPPLGGWM
eukprot:4840242-Pyramimonas_sp.AAC.1